MNKRLAIAVAAAAMIAGCDHPNHLNKKGEMSTPIPTPNAYATQTWKRYYDEIRNGKEQRIKQEQERQEHEKERKKAIEEAPLRQVEETQKLREEVRLLREQLAKKKGAKP